MLLASLLATLAAAVAPARPAHVLFLVAEPEYRTHETLPAFAKQELEPRGLRATFVFADPGTQDGFSGLTGAKDVDLLVVSVRRQAPRAPELEVVKQHLAAGKPIVGIRTASHAFAPRSALTAGHAAWPGFSEDVLGGRYDGHYQNKDGTSVVVVPGAGANPILAGLPRFQFRSAGTLYKFPEMKPDARVFLRGNAVIGGRTMDEPVAWTRMVGKSRVFYTSLGHPDDFADAGFRRLLTNAVYWALARPLPARVVGRN